MAQKLTLPPVARRGTHMPTGKNWRLLTPSRRRVFKVSLLTTFNGRGTRYAIFRVF